MTGLSRESLTSDRGSGQGSGLKGPRAEDARVSPGRLNSDDSTDGASMASQA